MTLLSAASGSALAAVAAAAPISRTRGVAQVSRALSHSARRCNVGTSTASATASTSTASISAALLLSRPPTIVRDPTAFESAYFLYNAKLQHSLAQPFPKDFYFKKGSAAEVQFSAEEKARKELYSGKVDEAAVEKAAAAAIKKQKQEEEEGSVVAEVQEGVPTEQDELYATAPRRTAADESGDVKSLDRALDRTLFLVVRGQDGRWRFPAQKVAEKKDGELEALHRTAPNAVHSVLGKDLDIWVVSQFPIAVLPSDAPATSEKTYFIRALVLAGQAAEGTKAEYAWLTSDEIEEKLKDDKEYLEATRDLLSV